jgi:hypothetical protein
MKMSPTEAPLDTSLYLKKGTDEVQSNVYGVSLRSLRKQQLKREISLDFFFSVQQNLRAGDAFQNLHLEVETLYPASQKVGTQPAWVDIEDIGEGQKLLYPLTVKVARCQDGIFIAECPTLDMFGQGETYGEALDDLKSSLVEDYEILSASYPDQLDQSAIKLLRLYSALLGKEL